MADEDIENMALPQGQTGSALDAVIASERLADLWQSLGVLPKRQRRVFVLYALDGWSCAEIADAEGISVGAVYLLLFRARRKMRSLRENGPLPAIVLPFSWLRWKLQRIEERVRPLLGVRTEGLSSACVQLVCLGALAMVVGATSSPAEPSAANEAVSSDETTVLASQSQLQRTESQQTALPNIGAPAKAPVESQESVVEVVGPLSDRVINPSERATPENTSFYSFAASPNYEDDSTILALGFSSHTLGMGTYVLFASHDGGANWKPLPSLFLYGDEIVLPPGYPHDRRVFTLGSLGFQQSDDGGEIFRAVSSKLSPWTRSLAISPLFGRGDSRILIGDKTLLEYDADTGVIRPGLLAIPPSRGTNYSSVSFSPGYPSDPTVLVSDSSAKGEDLVNPRYDLSTLYRCEGAICDERRLSFPGPLTLRLSPRFDQDGLAYGFTLWKLLVSNDGARTFQDLQFPLSVGGYIYNVAVQWNTSADPAVFVSTESPVFYRSYDAGRSWKTSRIDVPGFDEGGVNRVIVTPTGRLLAAGKWGGIVCSVDLGETWRPRCPPER